MALTELNEKIKNCTRCALSETREHAVCGEGNKNARVMLIAQAPGENDDEQDKMFIGPSGEILDDLLDNAEVSRDQIYMTNLIKCILPDYRKPKQDEIERCSGHLDKEIELVDPEILVPLGYYSTRYTLRKYDLPFDGNFSDITGELSLADKRKIYPLPHPASLLYDDSFKEEMEEDYKKLKIFLEPCKWYQMCPMKRYYEEGKLDERWVESYCKGDWKSCVRFKKEEKGEYHPDNMLPDGKIDEELES